MLVIFRLHINVLRLFSFLLFSIFAAQQIRNFTTMVKNTVALSIFCTFLGYSLGFDLHDRNSELPTSTRTNNNSFLFGVLASVRHCNLARLIFIDEVCTVGILPKPSHKILEKDG